MGVGYRPACFHAHHDTLRNERAAAEAKAPAPTAFWGAPRLDTWAPVNCVYVRVFWGPWYLSRCTLQASFSSCSLALNCQKSEVDSVPGLLGVFLLHPTLGLCIRFSGLLQQMTTNRVALNCRNLFSQFWRPEVRGQGVHRVRALWGLSWLPVGAGSPGGSLACSRLPPAPHAPLPMCLCPNSLIKTQSLGLAPPPIKSDLIAMNYICKDALVK